MKSDDRYSMFQEVMGNLPNFAYLAEETVYKVSGNWYELTYVPCMMKHLPEGIEYVAYFPHPQNPTLLEDGPQCIAKFKSNKPLPKKMEISYWTIGSDKEWLRKQRESDNIDAFKFLKKMAIFNGFQNEKGEHLLTWKEIVNL